MSIADLAAWRRSWVDHEGVSHAPDWFTDALLRFLVWLESAVRAVVRGR